MNLKSEEFKAQRMFFEEKVYRESGLYFYWFDKAAEAVFKGKKADDVIDEFAPGECDQTQSNGVVAGALTAKRLLK